jgi:hypothetical protein
MISFPAQRFGNLGCWGSRPTAGQRVDPAVDAAVPNAAGEEPPESIGEIADQMGSNSFDVPADA